MKPFDDAVLRQMYLEYDTPCDSLVSNPNSLQQFTQDYARRTRDTVDAADLSHRILYLRKRGEDKGGLPKIRRRYNGRN